MPGNTSAKIAQEAQLLSSDLQQESNTAREEAQFDASNLDELNRIRQDAEAQKRDPQRSKPGFFSRIISFFKYNTMYKSGVMEDGQDKRRADNHYENFLIDKLAYQGSGRSSYSQDGLSLSFSDSGRNIQNSFSNDSAAINSTRSEGGQRLEAATNVTYGGRLRLINATAVFKHRIFGDSTALYTADRVQLKLLGRFRDLDLLPNSVDGAKKMELLHNYTNGTDKFSGVVSMKKFTHEPDGVDIDIGAFVVRDGNKTPQFLFASGGKSFITISGENFTVRLKQPVSENGNIVSRDNALVLKNDDSAGSKGGESALSGSVSLTDEGISVSGGGAGASILRGKNNKLTIGAQVDTGSGGTETLTLDDQQTPAPGTESAEGAQDSGDVLTIGPVTFTGVKKNFTIAAGVRVEFSAKHASVKDMEHLSFSNIQGWFSMVNILPDSAVINTANMELSGVSCFENMNADVRNLRLTLGEGVTFDNIRMASKKLTIADILTAENVDVALTRQAGKPLTISAAVTDLNTEAKAGAFSLAAEKLSGSVNVTEDDMSAELTAGTLTAGLGGASLALSNIAYREKKLSFGGVTAGAEKINILNLIELSGIKVSHSSGGELSGDGLKFNDGTVSASAGLSLFGKGLGAASIEVGADSYAASLDLGAKDRNIINTSAVELSAHGKLTIGYADNADSISTENFGASALLGGALKLSADNIGGIEGKLTADTMTGGIVSSDGNKKDLLTVTANKVAVGNDGFSFESLKSKYDSFKLFGGVLEFDSGEMSAGSSDDLNFSGTVSGRLSVGSVTAGLNADFAFKKADGYLPTLQKVNSFDLVTEKFRIEKGIFTGNEDGSAQFTAEKLAFGKGQELCVTKLSGSASEDGVTIASAGVKLSGIAGISDTTADIKNLYFGSEGVSFDEAKFEKDVTLGSVLSAKKAVFSLSKPTGGSLSIKVSSDKLSISASLTPLKLSAQDISAMIAYEDGNITVTTTGDITAGLGDFINITAASPSYKDGVLGFSSVSAKVLKNEFLGGALKLNGLSAKATGMAFGKTGLITGENSAISITAESLSMLGTDFGALEATLDKSGFRASAEISAGGEEEEIFPNVKAGISGTLTVGYTPDDGITADMSDITAALSVFGNKLKATGMNRTDDTLTIESLEGQFALPGPYKDKSLLITGKKISIGKDFTFEEFSGKLDKRISFFNDMLYIDKAAIKLGQGLKDITAKGTVGFTSDAVSAQADGQISLSAEKNWTVSLDRISAMKLDIPKVGCVSVGSIAPEEKKLVLSDIAAAPYMPSGDNLSVMQSFLSHIKNLSVKLGKAYYEDGKFKPDMSTFKLTADKAEVDITDNLKGTLDITNRMLGLTYSLCLPSNDRDMMKGEDGKNYLPKLLSLTMGFGVPPLPLSVSGSIFAGACIMGDLGLSAQLDEKDGLFADDGDASHDLFIKGSASLDVANAGAGVEAAINLGVPGFANISAGLRGLLMAQAGGTKLEAGVGINYNTADKKFKLDRTNENTFFKFDINASLRAKLNAFVHGKLFAFINRDLVNISIADVNLGSVKFSGGAKLEQENWVFDKSDFKVDTDFKELLLKNRVIKHTEKSNVQLGEMEKIISDPDNAALFGGELGEQEALDRSAEIQAAVIPMLEQLRKMHKDSSKKLGMMDEQYHRSTDEMWNKIEADRVSIAGANSVINDIYERRDMAKKDPKKARAEAALKPVDFYAGLNGKDAPSALKIGELFFKGMETQSINATKDTVVRENTKPQTIYETFLPRAGFQPPTAILAAMSRKIYFKERGKGEELSAAMQRYVGIRQAINQVYENPNQSLPDKSKSIDNYEISLDQLKKAASDSTAGNAASQAEYIDKISESQALYKDLNKFNKEYVQSIADMKKYTAELNVEGISGLKKSSLASKLEKARQARESSQNNVRALRRKLIESGFIDVRETALTDLSKSNTEFMEARKKLAEARAKYHRSDDENVLNYAQSDITKFMKDFKNPQPGVTYNLAPLAKYAEVSLETAPVDLNKFRFRAWQILAKNMDDNEKMYVRYFTFENYIRRGGYYPVLDTVSNQMLKMMYTTEAYKKVTKSIWNSSDDKHSFTPEEISSAAEKDLKDRISEAREQDTVISNLENLIERTNSRYVEAEQLNNRLMKIGVEDFNNKYVESSGAGSGKIVPENKSGFENAMGALTESNEKLNGAGSLSMNTINSLMEESERMPSTQKRKKR